MAYSVRVGDRVLKAQPGQLLLGCLREAGLAPENPCGGQGTCGKCTVLVNGVQVRACGFRVDADVTVELPQTALPEILTSGTQIGIKADPLRPGWLIACDIGTTTVVCVLLDDRGQEVAVSSMLNPQTAFGADVVTRTHRAFQGDLEALTLGIRAGVEDLIRDCCCQAGIPPEQIGVVSIAGNPCMRQLFLGIAPDNLVQIPFGVAVDALRIVEAAPYISCCPGALMPLVPDISGYVGTDALGCVLASNLHRRAETVLLVDIGTNGELVLCHEGRMVACATAAGPALEGANIRCGMRGCAGAVDHVYPDGFHVIGEGAPHGICGSGIVDAVAVLLEQGQLNSRGKLLLPAGSWELAPKVTVCQEDIRQVQLAKGAVAAGIRLLCAHAGITPDRIDRCLLAGAFGTYLSADNACRIGLLPEELTGRVEQIGNGALSGAKLLAMDRNMVAEAARIAKDVTVLELGAMPEFRRAFAKGMEFREAAHG